MITRRMLFATAAAAMLPRWMKAADQADLARMLVRSPKPEDLEMPLDGFTEWITPIDRFFVRCHTYTPKVNLSDWSLKIAGKVDHPLTLTLDELKKFPRVELVGVLECAGNGRSFYQPRVAGTQWDFGSVGNGRWTGVRLRDVLRKAGIQSSGKEILCDGADTPLGKMQDFQRTITVEKAMHPDTLVAYEMNGQPLPVEHGFPLRVIAPGWAGDSWVKWLQHIEVLDHEFDGFWMKSAYRHPAQPVAPGTAVDPAAMIPVTDLNVKSVIAAPNGWAKPGAVRIRGTAWSNSSPVSKVEVSLDGGKTWKTAKLGGRATQYGWRLWQVDWKAAEGKYTLIARATNAAGQSQPLMEQWNPNGYLWNTAQPVEITIANAAPPAASETAHEDAQAPNGYKTACMGCHDDHMMRQQRLTKPQWDRELNKMTGWGAPLKPEDREAVLDYLSNQYK
ncbi:MAG TPA: sulfite oxidase [Bryobacteraceae bacterium]|nr:sulfite oxidase [Bryobacteraceae bacterium]